jgi:hypothetical protein
VRIDGNPRRCHHPASGKQIQMVREEAEIGLDGHRPIASFGCLSQRADKQTSQKYQQDLRESSHVALVRLPSPQIVL